MISKINFPTSKSYFTFGTNKLFYIWFSMFLRVPCDIRLDLKENQFITKFLVFLRTTRVRLPTIIKMSLVLRSFFKSSSFHFTVKDCYISDGRLLILSFRSLVELQICFPFYIVFREPNFHGSYRYVVYVCVRVQFSYL